MMLKQRSKKLLWRKPTQNTEAAKVCGLWFILHKLNTRIVQHDLSNVKSEEVRVGIQK